MARMTLTRLAGTALCGLFTLAPAWPQALADRSGAVSAAAAETMVLRVSLNTEDKGDLFVNRLPDGDFLVKLEDLKAMGFKEPISGTVVTVEGEPHLSLKSMSGVGHLFDLRRLSLEITAEPQLLPVRTFAALGSRRPRGVVPSEDSGFFNYSLQYANGTWINEPSRTFAAEAGWRHGEYLLLSDATTTEAPGRKRKLVRLMSSATRDDRETLQRWVVGDFFTQSRELSNGANLGGIGLSKLYGLNPYLVQFPTQSISGRAALPSDLEVYMDGQRIRTERIRPGEFEVRDIIAYGGARSIQLVLRDPFGRVQTLDYSFYFSDRPLQHGLHEYSYNLGAFRRKYGIASDSYGPAAYSAFHRYGFSDSLTFGMRAEGTRRLLNAGPSATLVLGPWGLLNLAAAASRIGERHGGAASGAYNYQSKSWNFSVSLRRDWGDYAVLGDPPQVTNRKYEANLVAGYNLPGRAGTVSLSHFALRTDANRTTPSPASPEQPFNMAALHNRRVSALSYSASLISGRASLTATLSHVKEKTSRNEAFIGVIFFLEKDYSSTANVRREGERHSQTLQLTKNQPIGEGLGYVVTADRSSEAGGSSTQLRSSVQYNAPAAILRADYNLQKWQHGQSGTDHRLSVAGGVATAGGEFGFGRPVVDSFGIVRVGELAGVKVLVAGQDMGKTDASGRLFVPTLSAYYDNDVSISAETVPIEYQIDSTTKKISPSLRSGALVQFAATRIQAFTGTLKLQNEGAPQTMAYHEVTLHGPGKGIVFQTGKGGEFYLENLKPGSYPASAGIANGKTCTFDLNIPRSDEMFVELPELTCRVRP